MDELVVFKALSKALLGFDPLLRIEPASLADPVAKDYLHRLREQFGAGFVSLLTLFDSKSALPNPLAATLADPAFVFPVDSMAKQVVHVWMLSQYRVETADAPGAPGKKGDAAPAFDAGFFEKGLVWPGIKAHPIGFSHRSHGYWESEPDTEASPWTMTTT